MNITFVDDCKLLIEIVQLLIEVIFSDQTGTSSS